jgi:hypothetical protein
MIMLIKRNWLLVIGYWLLGGGGRVAAASRSNTDLPQRRGGRKGTQSGAHEALSDANPRWLRRLAADRAGSVPLRGLFSCQLLEDKDLPQRRGGRKGTQSRADEALSDANPRWLRRLAADRGGSVPLRGLFSCQLLEDKDLPQRRRGRKGTQSKADEALSDANSRWLRRLAATKIYRRGAEAAKGRRAGLMKR